MIECDYCHVVAVKPPQKFCEKCQADPNHKSLKMPWLVQRIRRRDPSVNALQVHYPSRMLDQFFLFDYMGSAEFEYGALPRAFSEMVKEGAKWNVEVIRFQNDGKPETLFYVGPSRLQETAQAFVNREFQLYSHPSDRCLKERSYLVDTYRFANASPETASWMRYDGWWTVDEGASFVLFVKHNHAVDWLSCIVYAATNRT